MPLDQPMAWWAVVLDAAALVLGGLTLFSLTLAGLVSRRTSAVSEPRFDRILASALPSTGPAVRGTGTEASEGAAEPAHTVVRLAAEGLAAAQIAERTRIPAAEVALMLKFRGLQSSGTGM